MEFGDARGIGLEPGRPARPRQAQIGLSRRSRVLDTVQEISLAPPDLEGCGILLHSVVDAVAAEHGTLILSNPLTGQLEFVAHNQSPAHCRSYASYYGALDPMHLPQWLQDPTMTPPPAGSLVVDIRDHVGYDGLTKTEFYVDFMRSALIEQDLILFAEATPRTRAVLCLHRAMHSPPFSAEDMAVADSLAPLVPNHLQRMVATTVLAVLPDALDKGWILCDDRGRVLHCSEAARGLCASEPTHARFAPTADRVAATAMGSTGVFVGYALRDPEALAARCGFGINAERIALGPGRSGVLIVLDAPEMGATERAGLLRHRFGFTDREMQVLDAMMSGDTNREIALKLIVEECTVKKHMQSIADKVGVRTRMAVAHSIRQTLESYRSFGN